MPVRRFFLYAEKMEALRTEEKAEWIEATAYPHMDKKDRRRVTGRINAIIRRARGARKPVARPKKPRMVGDIPADIAALRALEAQSPLLRGLVRITKKSDKEKEQSS